LMSTKKPKKRKKMGFFLHITKRAGNNLKNNGGLGMQKEKKIIKGELGKGGVPPGRKKT